MGVSYGTTYVSTRCYVWMTVGYPGVVIRICTNPVDGLSVGKYPDKSDP